jgi:hypothetical protein
MPQPGDLITAFSVGSVGLRLGLQSSQELVRPLPGTTTPDIVAKTLNLDQRLVRPSIQYRYPQLDGLKTVSGPSSQGHRQFADLHDLADRRESAL